MSSCGKSYIFISFFIRQHIDLECLNLSEYALKYRKDAYHNKDELIQMIFDYNRTFIKKGQEVMMVDRFSNSFHQGWESLKDISGPAFSLTLAALMNKMEVLKC